MGDPAETIRKYAQQGKFSFPIGMDSTGGKTASVVANYGVNAFPTNYVVDSEGKVAFRCIGFDEKGIRSALARLGVE